MEKIKTARRQKKTMNKGRMIDLLNDMEGKSRCVRYMLEDLEKRIDELKELIDNR